jgi:hypothetical protein
MLNRLPTFALLLATLPVTKLPFTIEATEDARSEFPDAPRLQSFSFAQWKGRWVFIGGRIAGYHSVGGGPAEFLRADANRDVWVVDTTVRPARTYHVPVAALPDSLTPVKDQWTSTGQLYFQDGSKLYICGGYGQDHRGQSLTFPLISQVDLPLLIEDVIAGRPPGSSIIFASTPLVQSAGGELVKLAGDDFYLVMGHVFMGSYTAFEGHGEHNANEVAQTYVSEIRRLKIAVGSGGGLGVRLVQTYRDEVEFHRRDLNVTQILSPKGLGLAAYGGVFTPETQLSYSKPVYLFENSAPVVEPSFEQKMNAYACARLLMYNRSAATMYATFFGGISRFWWDPASAAFVENPRIGSKTQATYLDGMQWSDQISTIRTVMSSGKEETTELVHPTFLPGFLGTSAVFIPAPDVAHANPSANILDFEKLPRTKTLVGYIYGGVRAYPYRFPYSKTSTPYNAGTVPTKPSDLILRVYVQPQAH